MNQNLEEDSSYILIGYLISEDKNLNLVACWFVYIHKYQESSLIEINMICQLGCDWNLICSSIVEDLIVMLEFISIFFLWICKRSFLEEVVLCRIDISFGRTIKIV